MLIALLEQIPLFWQIPCMAHGLLTLTLQEEEEDLEVAGGQEGELYTRVSTLHIPPNTKHLQQPCQSSHHQVKSKASKPSNFGLETLSSDGTFWFTAVITPLFPGLETEAEADDH